MFNVFLRIDMLPFFKSRNQMYLAFTAFRQVKPLLVYEVDQAFHAPASTAVVLLLLVEGGHSVAKMN